MNHHFMHKSGKRKLYLFFAGWGMDHHPFSDEDKTDGDLCICYNYTDLAFDETILNGYEQVELIAWSMGVWAATMIFGNSGYTFTRKTAINGTPFPIDDNLGIPRKIFCSTLEMLSPVSLDKFYRRMCGSSKNKEIFDTKRPKRSIESLKTELQSIYSQSACHATHNFQWDKAIIGNRDLIFPPENQKRAWKDTCSAEVDEAHLPLYFLRYTEFK
ncbi:MAG: pimeloyl-ACP methyl esterase BioG family protein [Bacteroidales bacterium]